MRAPALAPSIAVALALAVTACDAAPGGGPQIPAAHPCPERALPPDRPSLWRGALATGAPVPLTIALPLPADTPAPVSQGVDQAPTHVGDQRWAWDFAVPLGTPAAAAAPGVVALVRDDSTRHGASADHRDDANFVLVDHGAGLYTAYVHLAEGSARVAPGDAVRAGDVLAETGLSGQLTGPHLHFAVENVWGETLPARFVDLDGAGCDLDPQTGDAPLAPSGAALPLVFGGPTAALPTAAFADDGVRAVWGLPARRLDRGIDYAVEGAADPGADEVYVLLLPEAGGDAAAFARWPVASDGTFAGMFALDPTLEAGRYGLGAVAVALGEQVTVDMAIRVHVE